MASASTSDRAADLDTNRGKRYRPLVELAAALAFLSVSVMWSRPLCPGVQTSLPVTSPRVENRVLSGLGYNLTRDGFILQQDTLLLP